MWISLWIAKAGPFIGCWAPPGRTSPDSFTRTRSETEIMEKCMLSGLIQKCSACVFVSLRLIVFVIDCIEAHLPGFNGSRSEMWPATPSSKPCFANVRNATARCCFWYSRSASLVANFGGERITTRPSLSPRKCTSSKKESPFCWTGWASSVVLLVNVVVAMMIDFSVDERLNVLNVFNCLLMFVTCLSLASASMAFVGVLYLMQYCNAPLMPRCTPQRTESLRAEPAILNYGTEGRGPSSLTVGKCNCS